jgi:hypothetical protein
MVKISRRKGVGGLDKGRKVCPQLDRHVQRLEGEPAAACSLSAPLKDPSLALWDENIVSTPRRITGKRALRRNSGIMMTWEVKSGRRRRGAFKLSYGRPDLPGSRRLPEGITTTAPQGTSRAGTTGPQLAQGSSRAFPLHSYRETTLIPLSGALSSCLLEV